MSYTDFTYLVGDAILWTTDIVFENVGNIFNYSMVALGLIGFVYWVRLMAKYRKAAANNPNIRE